MVRVRPSRRLSLVRPFAFLILSTVVPYLRANPNSVSLDFTTCFEPPPPELVDFFAGAESDFETTVTLLFVVGAGVDFLVDAVLEREEDFVLFFGVGGSSS